MMKLPHIRYGEWSVLLLIVFSVLWKGGGSIETTWLLSGTMVLLTLSYWWQAGKERSVRARAWSMGVLPQRKDVPLLFWVISLLFILWTIASFILSTTLNYGLDTILRTISYIFLLLWMIRLNALGKLESFKNYFPSVITTVAVLASLIGIVVYLFQPVSHFVGTFFDYRFHTGYWPNAWADFILLAWPIVFFCAWKQQRPFLRWALFFSLSLILSTLLLSYSRGAFVAFLGQLFVMGTMFSFIVLRDIRYRNILLKVFLTVLLRMVAVFAVALCLFLFINIARSSLYDVGSVADKVTFTAAAGRSSINERRLFWESAVKLIVQKPLFGWGPHSFRFAHSPMMQDVLATSDHPHNVLLKIAMESGLPALVFFLIIFGMALKSSIYSFLLSRKSFQTLQDVYTTSLIGSSLGLAFHSMIDYNIQFVSIGIIWMACLGLLILPASPANVSPSATFMRWKWTMYLMRTEILISIIVGFVLLWEGALLVTSSIGRYAHASGDIDAALTWYDRSENQLFSRDLFLNIAQLSLEKHQYSRADEAINTFMVLNDRDPRGWKIRGEIAMKRGRYEEAAIAFNKSYELGKYTDLGLTRMFIDALNKSGHREDILPMKHDLDELFIRFSSAIVANAHSIALSDNPEELLLMARSLSLVFPFDERRYKAIARESFAVAAQERTAHRAHSEGFLW